MLCKTHCPFDVKDLRGLIACFLVLGLALFHGVAQAQSSVMSMSFGDAFGSFKPEMTRQEVAIIARVLRLSRDEHAALETLHEGYIAALQTEENKTHRFINDAIERSQLLQDQALLQPIYNERKAWDQRAAEIKKKFFDDLRSILTAEQESRWPLAERELRRFRLIDEGRLFGESVDLIRLLNEVSPESFEVVRVQELVEAYAAEFDRALVARKEYIESAREAFAKACTDDPKEGERIWNEGLRKRQAVRGINERYLRLIAAELPPETAGRLQELFFDRGYARVVAATRGERFLNKAAALPSIDASQRASIRQVMENYDMDRRRLIAQAAALERSLQESSMPSSLAVALGKQPKSETGFNAGQRLPADHPLLAVRQARYELDRRARLDFEALLTPAQLGEIVPDENESAVFFYDYEPFGL
jgi:hypothetical protein